MNRILATTVASLLLAPSLFAVTDLWDGGGPDNSITGSLNWTDNTAPQSDLANTDLIFAGSVRLQPNVSAAFDARSVTFNNTAGPFLLTGEQLRIGVGGIVNNDVEGQTFGNIVTVVSNATLNAASGGLAFNGGLSLLTQTTNVTLAGPGSFSVSGIVGTGTVTKSGGGSMAYDPSPLSALDLIVNSGTVNLTGLTFEETFAATASIAVNGNGSVLNLAKSVVFSGTQLTATGGGTVTLALGNAWTIQNGGKAAFSSSYQQAVRANLAVANSGSTFTTGGDFQWEGGNSTLSLLTVDDGGRISSSGSLHLGRNNTAVSLSVRGAGSQINSDPSFTSEWNASVLLDDGSSATLGGLRLADGSLGGSRQGSLRVQGSSTVSIGTIVAASIASDATAEITIDGPGSQLTQTGTSALTLGARFSTTAILNVKNGAEFTSGTGIFTLDATGTVNIDGGTANFRGPLTSNGGRINLTRGELSFKNSAVNLHIGVGGILGSDLTLSSVQRLSIAGTTTIDAFRRLTLTGGALETGSLVNNGTLDLTSGLLSISGNAGFTIGASGALGSSVHLGTGANLSVTNTAQIAADSSLTVDGGRFDAGILNNSGTLRLDRGAVSAASAANNSAGAEMFISDTFSTVGTFANVNGARITLRDGSGRITGAGALSNSGLITGEGTIAKALTNNLTGEIRAAAGGVIALTGANGTNSGKFNLLGGQLDFTQSQTNGANGQINGHGTLNFAGGLAHAGQMNFSGGLADIFGTVNLLPGSRLVTSGAGTTTFYGAVTHNATEVRTSTGAQTVFFGLVNGPGSYTGSGAIFFEGGLSPGLSPAAITLDSDVVFGVSNTLTLELGGRIAGLEHDQLALGTTGSLTVDGRLVLGLINGFVPEMGDTFQVLSFKTSQVSGSFDDITFLGTLPGDLSFDTSRLLTSGILAVVPEPSSTLLTLAAGAGLAARRRKRTIRS